MVIDVAPLNSTGKGVESDFSGETNPPLPVMLIVPFRISFLLSSILSSRALV